MGLQFILELLALMVVLIIYAAGSVVAFKKKGFDPSLITMLSPLNFKGDLGLRLALGINLVACLISPLTPWPLFFTSLVTFGFAVTQILLLAAFNRSQTQPIINYYLLACLGVMALNTGAHVFNLVVLGAIAGLQEYYIHRFNHNRQQLYDNWVARQVHQINARHGGLRSSLSDEEWFHTLHIAVTENIARPKLSRLGETIYFHLKHPPAMSSGIMQVLSDHLLSDEESLKRGSQIVREILRTKPESVEQPIDQLRWLSQQYNGGLNVEAINRYTNYLLQTYPGALNAWQKIAESDPK